MPVQQQVSPPTEVRGSAPMAAAPEALFVASAISLYAGASLAVNLFDYLDPPAVAWLRVSGAALIVVGWTRPWRQLTQRRWSRRELFIAGAFGINLALMNLSFYMAIDRLQLGTAVAIEYMGPIAVAVWLSRTRRNTASLAVATVGVVLLSEVTLAGEPVGFAFAALSASLWAGYIVLGARVATGPASLQGLGLGMALGALVIAPIGVPFLGPLADRWWLLPAGLTVGLLSNAIPYAIDQVVFRRLSPGRFALLTALLPATAALMGFAILSQVPAATEAAGIALVVVAIAARDRSGEQPSVTTSG
jgi:inner membrane transporter RhtA